MPILWPEHDEHPRHTNANLVRALFLAAFEADEPFPQVLSAAGQAVASRTTAIAGRVSGPALAAHVTAAMRAAPHAQQFLCTGEEPGWLAPTYRWALVLDSLRTLERDPGAGPHPSASQWATPYGRAITAATSRRSSSPAPSWEPLRATGSGLRC